MRIGQQFRDLRDQHPVAVEVGTGIAAGVLVLVVTLFQWGLSEGLKAGSLGGWLGALVWFVTRRRRVAEERAKQGLVAQRLQLARELHDTVAGQVSVIGIQAAAARRVLTTRPDDAALALERIETASRAANTDLRRMLDALRGSDAVEPAGAAPGLDELEDLVAGFQGGDAHVTLVIGPGTRPVRDVSVDRAAFRVVQEALTNARRHAGDVPVSVMVDRDRDALVVDIVNGPTAASGHAVAGADGSGGGLGLVGLRERAALLGGTVDAGPTPDGGFAVRARLPVRVSP